MYRCPSILINSRGKDIWMHLFRQNVNVQLRSAGQKFDFFKINNASVFIKTFVEHIEWWIQHL